MILELIPARLTSGFPEKTNLQPTIKLLSDQNSKNKSQNFINKKAKYYEKNNSSSNI